MTAAAPRSPILLRDYRAPTFLISQTELRFELGEEWTHVHAQLTVQRNPASEDNSDTLRLQGEEMELLAIEVDGQRLELGEYERDAESLTLRNCPDAFTLQMHTRIQPQHNTALEGLYRSNQLFCTQCEAEGFRKITYFLDRPDVLSRFRTTIVAPYGAYPVLLSNGNPTAQGVLPDGQHWVTWEDPFPKPCYLFALVGGDLKYVEDIYFTKSGRRVTLRIYVEPEHLDQCDHAMESLKQAMRWDEERFGLEYDLDIYMIVAVQDFNMGAMENKGLNIFNAKYVLSRVDTATDADFENIESIVAHEYFHNYTGNRVTCRDWFQLSLKEGLTVFRDQEFTSDLRSRPVKRIQDVRFLRDYQFPEDASPTAHPVRPDSYLEINNFYTATVYEKGSEVIRMLQTVLGRDGFTKGVQSYLSQHDGSAATIEDFVAALEAANETDLSAFMRWYEQAGTPVVRARDAYDAARQRYELRLQQRYPAELAGDVVPIPIQLGLLSAEGAPIAFALQGQTATDHTFVMKSREETLTFEGIPSRPVPSLLRQFSAPVRLDYDFTTEQLALLYRHDTDAFNRWEAGQRLSTQIILDGMTRPPEVTTLVEGMRGILSEEHADLRFLTQLLSLPLEGFLTEQMSPIAPAKLRESLWGLERRLASDLRDLWRENYQRYHDGASADLSAEAAGRRAFKNFCLRRLGWLDEAEVRELALRQFQESRNMTDAMGALEVLTHSDGEERLEALDAFYARWQDDALVLDKWFRLQAVARRDKVLEEVHGLLQHPKFTYRTPNRVRSLVGAYAQGNFFQFHRPDGAGYRFLVDQILHLNAQNPQVAARLLTPLTRWSRFEPQQRQLMQLELQRLSKSANLSRDVYEIVSKSLKVSA